MFIFPIRFWRKNLAQVLQIRTSPSQSTNCTCARTEISQDANNADQKVKWISKVHKTYKLFWEPYFQSSLLPSFYSRSHFSDISIFTPKNDSLAQKLIKSTQLSITLRRFSTTLSSLSFLSVIAWELRQCTIPLKEEASLLRNFLPWSFADLTLLPLNVLNQKS